MKTVNELIQDYVHKQSPQILKAQNSEFQENHIAILDNFVPPEIQNRLNVEASDLIDRQSKRRELIIHETGGTPRSYSSVGRETIRAQSVTIPSFFESDAVLTYLSNVAGETLHRVPYAPEEYIINSQDTPGDTHGWHWDDYTYALIWIVEAPDPLSGGRVEYIPRTKWDKSNPENQLRNLLSTQEVKSRHVQAGCCYLLRASTTLHRIAPLTQNTRRTVIVFTYASENDLTDPTISHETMEQIYDPEIRQGV